jgi:hypothetical protein
VVFASARYVIMLLLLLIYDVAVVLPFIKKTQAGQTIIQCILETYSLCSKFLIIFAFLYAFFSFFLIMCLDT